MSHNAISALIILSAVFVSIAVRQVGRFRFHIWQIMLLGAAASIITGNIPVKNAIASINLDVMLFLFGMFIVGEALTLSGYLYNLSSPVFKGVKTTDGLIFSVVFVMGILSSFLMNDTVAIIGTPLVLTLAEKHNISSKLMLLTLCFAITLGSVASPIGNPQNLLIAVGGPVSNPFVTFLKYLGLPTLINLLAAYLILKLFYRDDFRKDPVDYSPPPILDAGLAALSRLSLVLTVILIAVKIATVFLNTGIDFKLSYIALASCLPVVVFSPKRLSIIRRIDWHTLVFFASLFVLMEAVWESGLLNYLAVLAGSSAASPVNLILAVSVLVSQLISNVPFVAVYLPLLSKVGASTKELMALASGSTIAGNLLILGAASNIIIIQNAEKRGHTITFFEFARVGLPLTLINILVYWFFLSVVR